MSVHRHGVIPVRVRNATAAYPCPTRVALAMVTLVLLAAPPARAQFAARASITPGRVQLGQPATYRGIVLVPRGLTVRWTPPDTGGAFTWSPLVASRSPDRRRVPVRLAQDTLRVETTLQAFALGAVPIPGLPFVSSTPTGLVVHRLPGLTLQVAPIIPARDTNPQLRPMRGPLGAPWWERVPWVWVIAGLLALLLLVLLVRRLRRRIAAPAPLAVPALDPAAEALAALEALRGLRLPEQARFAEHAFHLTRIVRRFLEQTEGTPRPGDTTRELVARLAGTRLEASEVTGLGALLQTFDLLKFARAAGTIEQAHRAERTVETLVRRRAAPAATPATPAPKAA